MTVDIKNIFAFGFTFPRKDSWQMLLKPVANSGKWSSIDLEQFQKVLNENVLATYENLIAISFVDLDSDTEFRASFINQKKLWKLEIPGSPDDAVSEDDTRAFFKAEEFKKICKRADEILNNAYTACDKLLIPVIKKGEMINVDEIKLEAIMHFLDDPLLRKNLKLGKFVQ